MSAPVGPWISAAIYAKMCGATDPVAVVEEAARRYDANPPRQDNSEKSRQAFLDHLRLIQELSEAQQKRSPGDHDWARLREREREFGIRGDDE